MCESFKISEKLLLILSFFGRGKRCNQGPRVPPPAPAQNRWTVDSGQKIGTVASGQKIGHWTVDKKLNRWTVRKKSDTGKYDIKFLSE